jgi:hypothetical protein
MYRSERVHFGPEDGGITFFQNVEKLLTAYTISNPRRYKFSVMLPFSNGGSIW